MVKKAICYAVIPLLVVLFILGVHFVTFQSQAIPLPPQLPSLPPLPTGKPITADISGEFTDPNFKKAVWAWLGKTGEPGAFSLMDIQNRISEGNTRLAVNHSGISSIKGVEYFEGITHLLCFNNKLTDLPSLPSTLQSLYCYDNQLTTLPDLPASLKILECQDNQLTTLPDLPAGLESLNCRNNKITVLPAIPASVTVLVCRDNNITELTDLPAGLVNLYCSGNQIRAINIPNTLKILDCSNNMLTSLPAIPQALEDLNVEDNYLTRLPATIPETLNKFNVKYNYIDFRYTSTIILNRPYYEYKPQCRIQYAGPEIIEVEMGKTVTLDNFKKQMSSDLIVWGDIGSIQISDLTFTSSNNSAARVDNTGAITGVSIGTAEINILLKGFETTLTSDTILVKVIPAASAPPVSTEPPATTPPTTTEPPNTTNPPVTQQPLYGETSDYAIPFMEQAVELGIITDRLKGQSMIVPTTREEFAEMAVRFYEKVTGNKAPIPEGVTFKDCNNPEVLKAYGLKITYGVGDGTKFEPNSILSRQQMAAMIERTLKACFPNIVIDIQGQPDFKDQKDFAQYAIVPAKFMAKYEITVGDGQGNFNPNGDCLRQQTFIFLVKAYIYRDRYIYE